MMTVFHTVAGVALTALGVAALAFELDRISAYALWCLLPGVGLLLLTSLQLTYYRSGTPWPADSNLPRPLRLTWRDYLEVAISWMHGFKRSYAVEPGLYYLGDRYDPAAPLLVTSNYHMTVFVVARRARAFNARLLVVDTDGINVWCAAGKGAFSNQAILDQLARYDRALLTDTKWLRLVLPKLAFAGVDLRALRAEKIRPIIGPIYAKDLPAYLAAGKLEDRVDDRVVFGLQSRVFTWLPGFVQYVGYGAAAALALIATGITEGHAAPLCVLAISAWLGTAYPILFPWLPGTKFAVKGLVLGAMTASGFVATAAAGALSWPAVVAPALFAVCAGIFVGLAYTGNSAVSNYTKVRKETAQFLPVDALLLVATVVAWFTLGGQP